MIWKGLTLVLANLIFLSSVLSSTLPPTETPRICDLRYFKHYETKGCTPIYDDADTIRKCPIRFACKELNLDTTVCKLNGVTYQLGSAVNSTNNCQYCHCRKQYLTEEATIQCITSECGLGFRPPTEGCYKFYEKDQCCPVEKCEVDSKGTEKPKVCSYNGKDYKLGQNIYPEEDPCLTCLCTENWTGINNGSCSTYNCELEKDIYKLAKNCLPIYHEKTCCPIEYHCPEDSKKPSNDQPATKVDSCYFEGRSYSIGQSLAINHPTNCVSCTCQVPPDFTCIHRSCPGPPNDDYKNCQSIYKPNTCCAEYNCKSAIDEEKNCPHVECLTPLCTKIQLPNECATCSCKPLCSPPKCPSGCNVEVNVPEGTCPGCACP